MDHVYFVNINIKKRTAKCLVHYAKHTRNNPFIGEICKALSVGNIRRSAINFSQLATLNNIPENSYVLVDVVVKPSPEAAYFMQTSGCLGFIGHMKEEAECVCFENVNVWPLNNNAKEEESLLASAQTHFNISLKMEEPVSSLVSVAP